jgi:hypothetical protein
MKNTLQKLLLSAIVPFIFSSCTKAVEMMAENVDAPQNGQYYKYVIGQGQHYANYNAYQPAQYDELSFQVKFDETAEYQTANSTNQEDINKLYGFSDNNGAHQQYSARFGWNWSRNALRLYAYVYNNGERSWKEIAAIRVGQEYLCSIKVAGDKYIFSLDDASIEMPRKSLSARGAGYKLYPYFGGDEAAPHNVYIWIKELSPASL